MTHTPPPWGIAKLPYSEAQIFDADMATVARVYTGDESGMANAALIAAAPDLLAALQKLKWVSIEKDNMEFKCEITCFVLDEIHAAIAKATGAP